MVTWYASTPKLVMAIWKMARDQHMFHRSTRSKSQVCVCVCVGGGGGEGGCVFILCSVACTDNLVVTLIFDMAVWPWTAKIKFADLLFNICSWT